MIKAGLSAFLFRATVVALCRGLSENLKELRRAIIVKNLLQVRTEHERAKHAALYVPVTDQPAYNLGKGSVTTCKVWRIYP